MKRRIFIGTCCVALLSVLMACLSVTGVIYRLSFDNMKTMIRDEATYIVASLNNNDTSGLEATKATFTRVTLVDPDGTVAFDSLEDPLYMKNHADRPEIAGALQSGAAEAQRYSETLAIQTYYRAVRLQNGQVVRVSGDMDSAWVTTLRYMPYIGVALVLAVLVSMIASNLLAKLIAKPMNSVNLDQPLSNNIYEELSPLFRRMERQRVKIQRQLTQMGEQKREFDAVTGNMREGLILLGRDAEVLSINQSALDALGLHREECIGKHILHMTRDEALQAAVMQGVKGEAAEAALSVSGRLFQVLCNPVATDTGRKGVVLLLLDVTDKHQAEQMRREFTANVSHELKTPLTSISGFAEIIKDGLAKPEDIPAFAGRIYNEARRLIVLVDDILRLSRLDEKNNMRPKESTELLSFAGRIMNRYQPLAEEKGISLAISGDEAVVQGYPQILEEIIGNLFDNAIKYNQPGGNVRIEVRKQPDGIQLSVVDTGIGIPKEHHARVFERFYRVDKSHSKETGGTGLGLSIVKHGILLHGARLELESAVNEGTTIRILFPDD